MLSVFKHNITQHTVGYTSTICPLVPFDINCFLSHTCTPCALAPTTNSNKTVNTKSHCSREAWLLLALLGDCSTNTTTVVFDCSILASGAAAQRLRLHHPGYWCCFAAQAAAAEACLSLCLALLHLLVSSGS